MQGNSNEEHFFYARGCSLVFGRGCVEEYEKGSTSDCISFLVQALQLAQKTLSAHVGRRIVEWVVLHRVFGILACSTEQKWSFLSPAREQSFIIEM